MSRLLNPGISYDPRLSTLLKFAEAIGSPLRDFIYGKIADSLLVEVQRDVTTVPHFGWKKMTIVGQTPVRRRHESP